MKRVSILNIMSQLKKMPVVLPETGEKVGQISDVVIHPTEGTVLGLIVQEVFRERVLYSGRSAICVVT
jgi:sporulation protein YlmC with PRC-barrel domain